ncbi:hypothetical protein CGRA01v4_01669 [Colletotrichum graminicola]|nr:hypothetical protein CGRA01v4_01669 [Colletotrichum graminicola]
MAITGHAGTAPPLFPSPHLQIYYWSVKPLFGKERRTPLLAVLLSRLSRFIPNSYQHHPFGDEPVKRCGGARKGARQSLRRYLLRRFQVHPTTWLAKAKQHLAHTRAQSLAEVKNSSYRRHPTYDTERVLFHKTPKSACAYAIVIGDLSDNRMWYIERENKIGKEQENVTT